MSRLLLLCVLLGVSCSLSFARLQAVDADYGFEAQGLELLEQRFGSAYPGYSNVGQVGGLQYGNIGASNLGLQNMQYGLGQQQQNLGMMNMMEQQPNMMQYGNVGLEKNWGVGSELNLGLGQQNLNLGLGQQQFGGLSGSFGAGGFGSGGSKKGQTTVAAPIYAESLIVPKVITQPILRPHMVTQPIIQQHLISQPIVETRQVIQPVVRRIITQPIIRPQILESTTIQPQLKTETIVQPHLIQQTVVTPQVQNVAMEAQPITQKATTQVQQAVVQPTQTKKGGQAGFGLGGF